MDQGSGIDDKERSRHIWFCLKRIMCLILPLPAPRGLRRGSATARLLRLRVLILSGAWMSVSLSVACWQVEVSATGRSVIQRILPSVMWLSVIEEPRRGRLGPLGAVEPQGKEISFHFPDKQFPCSKSEVPASPLGCDTLMLGKSYGVKQPKRVSILWPLKPDMNALWSFETWQNMPVSTALTPQKTRILDTLTQSS